MSDDCQLNAIRVHSVRSGHACNSSSTHSLLMLKREPASVPEQYDNPEYTIYCGERPKLLQFAFVIHSGLIELGYDAKFAEYFASSVTGVPFRYDPEKYRAIEHPSIPLPRPACGSGLHVLYLDRMVVLVKRPTTAVFAGHDGQIRNAGSLLSADNEEVLDIRDIFYEIPTNGDLVCRYDSDSGFFTIFNRNTGDRLRFEITGGTVQKTAALPSSPELVDLTITRFCPRECAYCYQQSGPRRKHGNMWSILRVLDALEDLETLEVAIGGGEPLAHPDIASICDAARRMNINMTTRMPHLFDRGGYRRVFDSVKAIAVTFEPHDDWAGILRTMIDISGRKQAKHKWQINIVLGLWEVEELAELADTMERLDCAVPVLFLGYKPTASVPRPPVPYGSGETEEDRNLARIYLNLINRRFFHIYEDWFTSVRADSVLTRQWKPLLEEFGVPRTSLTEEEGRFTCAIEVMPDGRVALSANSYDADAPRVDLAHDEVGVDAIKLAFRKIQDECANRARKG